MPAGKHIVLRNTFLRDYVPFEAIPEGAFHMKDVRKNLLMHESWEDSVNFSKGDEATLEQK